MIKSYHGKTPETDKSCFIAEDAVIIGDVKIGKDSSVWFHAVIRADRGSVRIGEGTNLQDGCIVHMDQGRTVRIGDYVTIGHGAILHGCTVEDGCLIGMGATLMNGCHIGRNCVIGAGALVTQNVEIPDGSLVMGVPGRVIRQLTAEEQKKNLINTYIYIHEAREYCEKKAEHLSMRTK